MAIASMTWRAARRGGSCGRTVSAPHFGGVGDQLVCLRFGEAGEQWWLESYDLTGPGLMVIARVALPAHGKDWLCRIPLFSPDGRVVATCLIPETNLRGGVRPTSAWARVGGWLA